VHHLLEKLKKDILAKSVEQGTTLTLDEARGLSAYRTAQNKLGGDHADTAARKGIDETEGLLSTIRGGQSLSAQE
jgi:hypothetical protein